MREDASQSFQPPPVRVHPPLLSPTDAAAQQHHAHLSVQNLHQRLPAQASATGGPPQWRWQQPQAGMPVQVQYPATVQQYGQHFQAGASAISAVAPPLALSESSTSSASSSDAGSTANSQHDGANQLPDLAALAGLAAQTNPEMIEAKAVELRDTLSEINRAQQKAAHKMNEERRRFSRDQAANNATANRLQEERDNAKKETEDLRKQLEAALQEVQSRNDTTLRQELSEARKRAIEQEEALQESNVRYEQLQEAQIQKETVLQSELESAHQQECRQEARICDLTEQLVELRGHEEQQMQLAWEAQNKTHAEQLAIHPRVLFGESPGRSLDLSAVISPGTDARSGQIGNATTSCAAQVAELREELEAERREKHQYYVAWQMLSSSQLWQQPEHASQSETLASVDIALGLDLSLMTEGRPLENRAVEQREHSLPPLPPTLRQAPSSPAPLPSPQPAVAIVEPSASPVASVVAAPASSAASVSDAGSVEDIEAEDGIGAVGAASVAELLGASRQGSKQMPEYIAETPPKGAVAQKISMFQQKIQSSTPASQERFDWRSSRVGQVPTPQTGRQSQVVAPTASGTPI